MSDPLTALETLVLRDDAADATVALAPARGGIVTRFLVRDRPVLYLDESTLLDPAKNIRGGVPVLFPSPGALADERSATLTLRSDEATRAQFPWDFVLTLRYALDGARLRITQRVENHSGTAMPFAMGFHPYFHVPDGEKARTSIATAATRAFDNTIKTTVALEGPIDLTRPEVDLHLDEHGTLVLADGHRVEVTASPEFTRWVIWTLRGKDFVCLEPWTAPGDALNTREGIIVLAPGEARDLWVEIALTA